MYGTWTSAKRFDCIFDIDFFVGFSFDSSKFMLLFFSFFFAFLLDKIQKYASIQLNRIAIFALLQTNKTIMTTNGKSFTAANFKGSRSTSIFLYIVCLPFNPFSERTQCDAYRLLIKIQSITSSFHGVVLTSQSKSNSNNSKTKNLLKIMTRNIGLIEFGCSKAIAANLYIAQCNIDIFYSWSTSLIKIISIWNC